MQTIFTHFRPDLDAATSVWFFSRFVCREDEINLVFVPANWDGSDMLPGDVALDIQAGGQGEKGRKLPDGRVMSCFATLVERHASAEQFRILQPLSQFVDAQDSTGDAILAICEDAEFCVARDKHDDPGYRPVNREDVPPSLRVGNLASMFRVMERLAKGNDRTTVLKWSEILDAIYESGVEYREANKEAGKGVFFWSEADPGRPAVVLLDSTSKNPHLHARVWANTPEARVLVRLDAHNLCVLRRDTEKRNLGEIVRPFIDRTAPGEAKEWFYHSAGFLAARGTLKSPATTPSNVDARALAQHIAESLT